MDSTWQALAREAGVAAEQIAIGATALGRANYAQQAYFGQAFFGLSIGFERSAKLALVVDHALQNAGNFPDNRLLRDYGHDLSRLFESVNQLAVRRGLNKPEERLPSTLVHQAVTKVLSQFATNVTRYYNLDFVTKAPSRPGVENPVAAWHREVTGQVIAIHCSENERAIARTNAQVMQQLMGGTISIRHFSVTGKPLDSVGAASLELAELEFARPYVRQYVLQFARFFYHVMRELA